MDSGNSAGEDVLAKKVIEYGIELQFEDAGNEVMGSCPGRSSRTISGQRGLQVGVPKASALLKWPVTAMSPGTSGSCCGSYQ